MPRRVRWAHPEVFMLSGRRPALQFYWRPLASISQAPRQTFLLLSSLLASFGQPLALMFKRSHASRQPFTPMANPSLLSARPLASICAGPCGLWLLIMPGQFGRVCVAMSAWSDPGLHFYLLGQLKLLPNASGEEGRCWSKKRS